MLNKRHIKSETKRNIRLKLYFTLLDNLQAIRNSVMKGFLMLENLMENTQTSIDLTISKEVFLEHLMSFDFLPESDSPNRIDLVLPNIDNFDFSDIEIIELILNGVVGEYAEANSVEVEKLFGNVHDSLLHTNSVYGDFVYIVPVSENLILQEEQDLGYSLNRFPFSNSPPMYDEFFSKSTKFIQNNLPNWVSTSIKTSLKGVVNKYGGK